MSRPTRRSAAPTILLTRVLAPLLAPLLVTLLAVAVLAPIPGPEGTATVASAGAPGVEQRRTEALDTKRRVLVISVDGLRSSVLKELDAAEIPTLTRLRREGAGTLDARTVVEQTETLPDHTSMVTGRRIDAARGGHGVTWNTDQPGTTVHQAAGEDVGSVFARVHRAGGTTALFTGKSKFSLFQRSWPKALDRYTLDGRGARLVRKARKDLRRETRTLTFLHLAAPDLAGHAHGWASSQYADAVRTVDGWLSDVLDTVAGKPMLRKHLTIVLTSDHGGSGTGHADATVREHYRVPFWTWGDGVDAEDLYALNPTYKKPRRKRPGYGAARQPVRNGDVANLALSLLGLRAIPGSTIGTDQDLVLTADAGG